MHKNCDYHFTRTIVAKLLEDNLTLENKKEILDEKVIY